MVVLPDTGAPSGGVTPDEDMAAKPTVTDASYTKYIVPALVISLIVLVESVTSVAKFMISLEF